METIEISKKCKYGGDYDVIVCGGGPSGVCAAISSAREGAKTLLIEKNGELGGFWISGLLTWFADIDQKGGLIKELLDCLKENADGRIEYRDKAYFTSDTESTKIIFQKMCRDAGVDIRLYTFVTDVVKDGNKIKSVVTESKSGAEYFNAKVVIDATGDGDVGAFSGCSYEIGNEEGKMQPMSLIALVGGVKYDDVINMYQSDTSVTPNRWIYNEIVRGGVEPSYIRPLFAPISKENNLFALMANHEYNVSSVDANDLSKATLDAREEVYNIVKGLKSLGGMWKDAHVVTSATNIGVREGRRIKGKYKIKHDIDLIQGLKHDDGVCVVTYNMDIHQLSATTDKEDAKKRHVSYPYEIPLRALISDEVENLMMAGRCISGDFYSYGNYRVGGNAARTGEAAGLAAAYSVINNSSLDDVCPKIKELLKKHDK